jgi:hypothetical protein
MNIYLYIKSNCKEWRNSINIELNLFALIDRKIFIKYETGVYETGVYETGVYETGVKVTT